MLQSLSMYLSEHEADGVPRDPSLGVEVVQMVHDELRGGRKVGLVELVRNVPAERSKFSSFLFNKRRRRTF